MKIFKGISFGFIILILCLAIYYFFPDKKLDASKPIEKLLVIKSKRKLLVLSKGQVLKEYSIALGRNPLGAKHFEGDDKTPEGIYQISNKNPHSGYYLNLGISYPKQEDRIFAKKYNKKPGGDIKIHGLKNGMGYIGKFHCWFDWTRGCIALTNEQVKELYENVKPGTQIEIVP